jgi:hypothetical protein
MKATFSTFAFLFSFFSIYAQKEPIVTDRPIFFDSFAKESRFLESVYDYYEEQIKDLPSGDEIKYFGYYSPGRNSSVKALVTSDTIEFIISLKPRADISKYNLVAIKLFYNAVKNRREALVGFKQGITRVFAPLTLPQNSFSLWLRSTKLRTRILCESWASITQWSHGGFPAERK